MNPIVCYPRVMMKLQQSAFKTSSANINMTILYSKQH